MKSYQDFMVENHHYTLPQAIQTLQVLEKRLQETDEHGFATIAEEFTRHISILYKIVHNAHEVARQSRQPPMS